MNLFVFILATIGLTNIIYQARILDLIKIKDRSIREWLHYFDWSKELCECPECTGFWAGLICGFFVFNEWHLKLMAPLMGTVVSPFYHYITTYISSITEFSIPDETSGD